MKMDELSGVFALLIYYFELIKSAIRYKDENI